MLKRFDTLSPATPINTSKTVVPCIANSVRTAIGILDWSVTGWTYHLSRSTDVAESLASIGPCRLYDVSGRLCFALFSCILEVAVGYFILSSTLDNALFTILFLYLFNDIFVFIFMPYPVVIS